MYCLIHCWKVLRYYDGELGKSVSLEPSKQSDRDWVGLVFKDVSIQYAFGSK